MITITADDRARDDDAVGEHESVSALGELPGHEVVARGEGGEPGEVGEAGVGREHEDQHRAALKRVEQHASERTAAEDRLADLRDDGRGAARRTESRACGSRGARGRGTARRGCCP